MRTKIVIESFMTFVRQGIMSHVMLESWSNL